MQLRYLSNFTTDPQRTGEAMLEAAKSAVKMTKSVLAVNLLKGLMARRL